MNKYLQNLFASKKEEVKKKTLNSSLAPKVLTEKGDIEKIQPYLDKLNETIDTKGINNIALTGGYGSGKSTIIGTFKELNRQYEFLNISLASFNKKKSDDTLSASEKKLLKEELERLLEVSILQQIFYHVKPEEIPESRFKRIINIPNWKIWSISIGFIMWVSSSVLLLKYDYLNKINPNSWNSKDDFDLFSLIIFIVEFIGLGLFSKLIIKLFSNSKINKVNIKGELELGEKVNKSVFNEHLEEILYFFEVTKYDVVVIEDLDRFDSTDIFTKLREINILLNNSKLINREINFVYAVGDDLFDDKKERVKFFEYIIPVIPFINSSNADDQLRTLIKEAGLDEGMFTQEFISDVTTFIDDIDMRLLSNIFHEFVIYRKTLKPEFIKKNDELFAMITYKNIDPKDFTKLNRKEGVLYELINNKDKYINKFVTKIDNEIANKISQIKSIEEHTITDINDLKSIYFQKILTKLPYNALVNKESIEGNIESLFESQSLTYYHYDNSYRRLNNDIYKFKFSEIENEINENLSYDERVYLINSKRSSKITLLKSDIEKLKSDKIIIENWDLMQIFNEVNINEYLKDFSNNGLLRNFILNGYINENYNDYISLFHEVSITKEDFTFERNVKNAYFTDFNYRISDKIENLIDRIDKKYFEREAILNFDIIDYLGRNYSRYIDKYDFIIRLLSNEKEKSIQFIDEYIKNEERPIEIFIKKLAENWRGFWDYIYYQSSYSDEKKSKYLYLFIRCIDVESIIKNQNEISLKEFIEQDSNFLCLNNTNKENDYYSEIYGLIQKRKIELLKTLKIEFDTLNCLDVETTEIFKYVYQNNHYKINKENIFQMIRHFGVDNSNDRFENSNYTTILQSNCKPLIDYINSNINMYVESIYLKLEQNISDNEDSLLKLLNNENLDDKLKVKIVQKTDTLISDLGKIENIEIKKQLLNNLKAFTSWGNVIDYYNNFENKIDETLIKYLNLEIVSSELSKLKLTKDDSKFELDLVVCNEIEDKIYNNLLDSCFYVYSTLSFENVSLNKAVTLTTRKLRTTKSNYNILRQNFANNHITLIERNFNNFYDKQEDFKTDENDILMILKSDKITIDDRFKYISKLIEQTIIDNKAIAKKVGEIIIIKTSKVEFGFNTIESILKSLDSLENKTKFINLYFTELSSENIILLVKSLSYNHSELFVKQHKPSFNDNIYNRELLTNLKSKRLIKDFGISVKDNTKIRAIANY